MDTATVKRKVTLIEPEMFLYKPISESSQNRKGRALKTPDDGKDDVAEDRELRRLLWYVLGGARGGQNRARMIHQLELRPLNMNQLAEKLGVDYRTIMHHTAVLRTNSLVETQGDKYGSMIFLTPRMQAGM